MKSLLLVVAVMLVQRSCFCAALNVESGVREVVVDNADARVVEVNDHLTTEQQLHYDAHWSKTRSELVEQHSRLSSKKYIDAVKGARSSAGSATKLWHHRWTDFLDGKLLSEFLVQCESNPVYKASATQNLSAMKKQFCTSQFVAFVSIGYAVVAIWLGPIKLTCWQQRSVLVTYTAAGIVQAIFLTHAFSFIDIHYVYPSTLALTATFFVGFNLTNAVLVLESEITEPAVEAQAQEIVEASSIRVVTAQRAVCF